MRFYRIRHSLDTKITGKYPQIKDIIYTGKVHGNPKSINTLCFTKIEFEPEVPKPILHNKAKKTDLIEAITTTPFNLLISGKLKALLQASRKEGLQFFQSSIFHQGIENIDYWFLNLYVFNNEYIDYENCKIKWEKKAVDFDTTYNVDYIELRKISEKDFFVAEEKAKINMEAFFIEKLALQNVEENFFGINDVEGGVGFYVSEKLKNEIEEAGCTGIEFQPSELSYNDWVARGGEREIVYGRSW
jgi:hypothetical protein